MLSQVIWEDNLISHLFVRYFAHFEFQISDLVKWFQQNVPEEQGRGVQAQMTWTILGTFSVLTSHLFLFFTHFPSSLLSILYSPSCL